MKYFELSQSLTKLNTSNLRLVDLVHSSTYPKSQIIRNYVTFTLIIHYIINKTKFLSVQLGKTLA